MKIKITVSYEIDNFIDEDELQDCYDGSLEDAFSDIRDREVLFNLVNLDTEKILKLEKIQNS